MVGALVWFVWTVFVHAKYSGIAGISKMIFGANPILGTPWTVIDPFIPALLLSSLTLVVVWALDRRPEIKSEVVVKQTNT